MLQKIVYSILHYTDKYVTRDEHGKTERDYIRLGRRRDIVFTEQEIKSIREAYLKPYKGHETKKENCYWAADWLITGRMYVVDYFGYMARALSEAHGAEMIFNSGKFTRVETIAAFYKLLEDPHKCFETYGNEKLTDAERQMLFNKILTDSWDCYRLLRYNEEILTEDQRKQLFDAIVNSSDNGCAIRDSFEHSIRMTEEERMMLVKAIAKYQFISWFLGRNYYRPKPQDWEILKPVLQNSIHFNMDEYDMWTILDCNPPEDIKDLICGIQVMRKLTS